MDFGEAEGLSPASGRRPRPSPAAPEHGRRAPRSGPRRKARSYARPRGPLRVSAGSRSARAEARTGASALDSTPVAVRREKASGESKNDPGMTRLKARRHAQPRGTLRVRSGSRGPARTPVRAGPKAFPAPHEKAPGEGGSDPGMTRRRTPTGIPATAWPSCPALGNGAEKAPPTRVEDARNRSRPLRPGRVRNVPD